MRFYNVEMKGKFKLDPQASLPPFDPADEGRLMYYNGTLYYTDSTAQTTISTAGGGAAAGNAACLEGNPGSYYLDRANHTGTNDADLLDGQAGSYYLDATNTIGVLPVINGGTGATDSTGLVSNLGLDDWYGRLDQLNTWTAENVIDDSVLHVCGGNSCICWRHQSSGDAVVISNDIRVLNVLALDAPTGVYSSASCDAARAVVGQTHRLNSIGVLGCLCTSNPARIGTGVCGFSSYGNAVSGNVAYAIVSSKNLKHLRNICISSCIKENPLNVYQYYWEDSNYRGFNQTIGPTSEEFNKTFNVNNSYNGDDYENLWTVDGVALGLGIENLKEIDRLKLIVTKLYSCIQKLESGE